MEKEMYTSWFRDVENLEKKEKERERKEKFR